MFEGYGPAMPPVPEAGIAIVDELVNVPHPTGVGLGVGVGGTVGVGVGVHSGQGVGVGSVGPYRMVVVRLSELLK